MRYYFKLVCLTGFVILILAGCTYTANSDNDPLFVPTGMSDDIREKIRRGKTYDINGFLSAFDKVSKRDSDGIVTSADIHAELDRSAIWWLLDQVCGHHWDMNMDATTQEICDAKIAALGKNKKRKQAEIKKRLIENTTSVHNVTYDLMRFDLNNDGRLLREEIVEAIVQIQKESPDQKPVSCTLPPVPETADVIFVSTHHGAGMPTVTVNDQDGVTSSIRIKISPTNRDIYLVATASGAIIWRLEGDVDRITQFVTQPSTNGIEEDYITEFENGFNRVGVTGLPKEKVAFLGFRCLGKFGDGSNYKEAVKLNFETDIGRSAQLFHIDKGRTLALPEGITAERYNPYHLSKSKPFKSNDAEMKMLDVINEGVIELRTEEVISLGRVESYQSMPGYVGLVDLVKARKIKQIDHHIFETQDPYVKLPIGLPSNYKLVLSETP